jgi:hypothetical protein
VAAVPACVSLPRVGLGAAAGPNSQTSEAQSNPVGRESRKASSSQRPKALTERALAGDSMIGQGKRRSPKECSIAMQRFEQAHEAQQGSPPPEAPQPAVAPAPSPSPPFTSQTTSTYRLNRFVDTKCRPQIKQRSPSIRRSHLGRHQQIDSTNVLIEGVVP